MRVQYRGLSSALAAPRNLIIASSKTRVLLEKLTTVLVTMRANRLLELTTEDHRSIAKILFLVFHPIYRLARISNRSIMIYDKRYVLLNTRDLFHARRRGLAESCTSNSWARSAFDATVRCLSAACEIFVPVML